MNDVQLFETLKRIQCQLENGKAQLPGLSETRQAVEQAVSSYHKLNELCEEISRSQRHLNELAHQASQVRGLFSEALNVISFNITQIQDAETANSSSQEELKTLKQSLTVLEKLVDKILVNNVALVIQEKSTVLNAQSYLEHIVDRISLVQKNQQAWKERTGKCLIIDQDMKVAESLQCRLAHEGYEAFVVADFATAHKILIRDGIDILLIDIEAARGDYAPLVAEVVQGKSFDYISMVVMGDSTQFDELGHLLASGAEDFLIKPVNPLLLKSRVKSSIEKRYAYELRKAHAEESVHLREELSQTITELTECFIAFDHNQSLLVHNAQIFDFFPCLSAWSQNGELVGMALETWLTALFESGLIDFSRYDNREDKWFTERLQALSAPASVWREYLLTGQILQITSYRTVDGGTVVILKSDTDNHEGHERLTYMAYHDVLTGLANREQFYKRLKQMIARPTSLQQGFAVLFMDLDGFKRINDANGHDVGDWLLIQIAQRLRNCMREQDIVARIGGDEFAALIHNISDIKMVAPILERIIATISLPIHHNNLKLPVGISIGAALYPHHSLELEVLVSQADAAMYSAKQAGRMAYRFYEPGIQIRRESMIQLVK